MRKAARQGNNWPASEVSSRAAVQAEARRHLLDKLATKIEHDAHQLHLEPFVAKSGIQEIMKSSIQEFRKPCIQEFRNLGNQSFRNTGNQASRNLEIPGIHEIRHSGIQEIGHSGI